MNPFIITTSSFNRLIKLVAKIAYPGAGMDGRWDVDGLRSRCVARLRVAVGAALWRGNHKTIASWKKRSYPDINA